MANYIEDGAHRCLGGIDRLVALLDRRAVQMLTDRRGATGVELDAGQRISAKSVVSAIDAPTTFQRLLGA